MFAVRSKTTLPTCQKFNWLGRNLVYRTECVSQLLRHMLMRALKFCGQVTAPSRDVWVSVRSGFAHAVKIMPNGPRPSIGARRASTLRLGQYMITTRWGNPRRISRSVMSVAQTWLGHLTCRSLA